MRLDLRKELLVRSERVKSIDFHPTENWILASLYNGHVLIYDSTTGHPIKSFEVTDVPVRAGKFIPRKNWLVCGADDFQLRVYNYNTHEKITQFEAHPDYIRCCAVHPSQPFVLTGSDDMTIKLWNWEREWKCQMVFEGHSHYVMSLAINPKDTNTFASSCLDRTIKVWSFNASTPNYTIDAHEKGVNHVDYYHAGDKPFLVSTGDDRLVKIWDYQSKACIQTLEGHTSNVSFACFHPELPVIISGAEDSTIKIWHANTYRLEQTLNYGLERAWCVSYIKGRNAIAMGFDDGAIVIKLGREEPACSMDGSGKVIWAKHNEVQTTTIKPVPSSLQDGEVLPLPPKDLGSCEVYPQTLAHSPNGRFVVVCGDGEYIIYTALAWRNKAFGSALEFVWAADSNEYAIRESANSIRLFKNFKEKNSSLDFGYAADRIFGGVLLGIKGADFVCLHDWDSGALVRRIEVAPKNIYWSENGTLVAIACAETLYILRYDRDEYLTAVSNGDVDPEMGVENSFELIADISEDVKTGKWVGDCFIYTNATNRLNYLVGSQTYTISNFDNGMYLLGYLPRDGRIYLADKDVNVISFSLSVKVLEYQTFVLRGDMDSAAEIFPQIPENQKNKIARFLDGQGHKELALEVTVDAEQKFDLAIQLNRRDIVIDLARQADNEPKWRTVGDWALKGWDLELAEECFRKANDLSSLLLIYTSTGNAEGLKYLADKASEARHHNIAFASLFELGNAEGCTELLVKTHRYPEATLFASTYAPKLANNIAKEWKSDLEKNSRKTIASMIAVPEDNADLFPDWAVNGNGSLEDSEIKE